MMKRIMWIIAMIPTIVTAVVYQFLPKEMPMHYDINGWNCLINHWKNDS